MFHRNRRAIALFKIFIVLRSTFIEYNNAK